MVVADRLLDLRPLLLVSDFDGTLSPIVLDPWGAQMVPLARRALRHLAGIEGIEVAILSGRTAGDVAVRARIGGTTYLGNHGVEYGRLGRRQRAGTLAIEVVEVASHFADVAERLAAGVPGIVSEPWLVVERKSPAVAFHFRAAPDVEAAGRRVLAAVDRLDPEQVLVRFPGRRVLELRPTGLPAKGDAMLRLLRERQPRAALMLGDDVSDAEAFRALTSARVPGVLDGLAIAVQARDEVPPQVTAAADIVLASPAEAARFLAAIARRASRERLGAPN